MRKILATSGNDGRRKEGAVNKENFRTETLNSTQHFNLDFFAVKRTVGAVIGPQSSSKVTFIVAIVVSVVLFILLLIAAATLYRRRQLYDGFYICNSPPLPDLIARLDSSIPLIEQVNKLPYDKRWEFPREQLQMGKNQTFIKQVIDSIRHCII